MGSGFGDPHWRVLCQEIYSMMTRQRRNNVGSLPGLCEVRVFSVQRNLCFPRLSFGLVCTTSYGLFLRHRPEQK